MLWKLNGESSLIFPVIEAPLATCYKEVMYARTGPPEYPILSKSIANSSKKTPFKWKKFKDHRYLHYHFNSLLLLNESGLSPWCQTYQYLLYVNSKANIRRILSLIF
uniref:Uncharacterized protein n=1 Tax=Spongospora subterranea TaxID=70186 RepID=A0A0H5R3U0_9EUKA|eukprot:CRZ02689.1 hypothetical protein [Spongospora subterranea]